MSPLSRSVASPNTLVSAGNQLLLHILVGGIVLLHFEIRHSLAFSVSLDGSPKTSSSTKPPNSPEEIEAFVKTLEYQATKGYNVSQNDLVKIDLNLLDDDTIGLEIQDGLQEEFEVVDEAQRETTNASVTAKPGPSSRQLSLIYQGVYAPDSRFNAFADGVMVNMVAEMKRKRMDPLYFRVYDRGIVEHVTARAGREGMQDGAAAVSPSVDEDSTTTSRQGRQRGNAIGGGVIRGLTNTKRFGNAEVQIAGNSTLVRSHYVFGPLNIELVYNTEKGVKTINSTLGALATHAVSGLKDNSSKLIDFIIDSPLFDYMPYYGNRTLEQQKTTEQVVRHLFSNDSFMTVLMKDSFEIASYDKIIPQFGTESNYYSVLKYLFDGAQRGNARTHQPAASKGVSLPGIPSLVAAHLAGTAASSAADKQGPRTEDLTVIAHPFYEDLYKAIQFEAILMLFSPQSFLVARLRSAIRLAAYVPLQSQPFVLGPSDYEVQLVGTRSQKFQRISQSAIRRLFKPTGTLERRLKQQFVRSRSRRIPDVTKRSNRSGRRNQGNRKVE